MIPAVTFTHSGGSQRLEWWVRGVRLAGMIPVVCDDANDPILAPARGWLAAEGVEYRQTTWPRRGNLNGTDTAARICMELAMASTRHGSRMAFKVDDDTVIIRPGRIVPEDGIEAVGLVCPGDGRGGAYGMCYGLRWDLATACAGDLVAGSLNVQAPEDLAVWGAVKRLATEVAELPYCAERGPFAALAWGSCPVDACRRYDVVTVGNPPAAGWIDRPRQTAALMRSIVEAAERLQ